MLVNFWQDYKVEVYEEKDKDGFETGFTNIDLYKSINTTGWKYRLTLQVQELKDIDYIIKKLIDIDKGE